MNFNKGFYLPYYIEILPFQYVNNIEIKSFNFHFFFGCPMAYGIPRLWIRSKLQLQPMLQLQKCGKLNPLEIKPASQCFQDTTDPVAPQQELLIFIF